MGGRNRIVGGRKFLERGAVSRGKVNVLSVLAVNLEGPTGADGADGADGTDGTDGADGTQVETVLSAGFDPDDYPTGTVVFLVTSGTVASPVSVDYGGKKGDGGGGGFPDPIEIA